MTTNTPTIHDLREAIFQAGPERFNISIWFDNTAVRFDDEEWDEEWVESYDFNDCGTTACISGWGQHLLHQAGLLQAKPNPGRGKGAFARAVKAVTKRRHQVLDHFGLDENAQFLHLWSLVRLTEGETMHQRWLGYIKNGYDNNTAQWMTVLDYLDMIAKRHEEITEQREEATA